MPRDIDEGIATGRSLLQGMVGEEISIALLIQSLDSTLHILTTGHKPLATVF